MWAPNRNAVAARASCSFRSRYPPTLSLPSIVYRSWHIGVVTPSRDGNDSWRNLIVFWITPPPGLCPLIAGELLPPMPGALAPPSMSRTVAGLATAVASSAGASEAAPALSAGGPVQTGSDFRSITLAAVPQVAGITSVAASASGSGAGTATGVQDPPAALAASVPSTSSAASPSSSPSSLAGRTFMVLVNYSDRASNGHVLFTRADDSAFGNPDSAAAAAHVASLCRGHVQPRGVTGTRLGSLGLQASTACTAAVNGAPALTGGQPNIAVGAIAGAPAQAPQPSNTGRGVPSGAQASVPMAEAPIAAAPASLLPPAQTAPASLPETSTGSLQGSSSTGKAPPAPPVTSATAAPASAPSTSGSGSQRLRRIGLVDQLSAYVKEYPSAHVAAEGWWVQLEPWRACVLEVLQLGEE